MTRLIPRLLSGSIALLLVSSIPGSAQTAETPPAHVSYTDGVVIVEHDATAEEVGPNTPLLPGDRIRTEAGRAEVLFGDGSLVHLDEHTSVDLLSASLLRLMGGRIVVVAGSGLAGQLQVDAAAASVRVLSAGEYRVSLLARGDLGDLELAVIRGSAELIGDTTSLTLRAGERAVASLGAAPGGPWPFNSAQFDAFDRWSQVRLEERRGPTSYEHVPPELRSYAGTFDTYGAWNYQPSYGYVWFPQVDHGWRPYYHGRWKHYRRFGWTWIGGPRWAWPTHHYGRWGVTSAGAWFWIPGRHWGAAWVHWGVAPGYVSWCPLGFDNRPVFAFWSHRSHRFHNPWRGWTVVHRSRFGDRRHVRAYALDGGRIASTHGRTFVTQNTAPEFRDGSRSGRRGGDATATRQLAVPRRSAAPGSRRGSETFAAVPSRRPRSLGVRAPSASAATVAAPSGSHIRSGSRLATRPRMSSGSRSSSASDTTAGITVHPGFRRAVPRRSETSPRWRAEDIPVHRGTPVGPPAPVASEPQSSEESSAPEAPSYREAGRRSGIGTAVSRGGRTYSPPPARTTDGPSRGSVGVPSPQRSRPSASPQRATPSSSAAPSSRGDDSGGRARQAPEGSSGGGKAVGRSSGSRGGARSRR